MKHDKVYLSNILDAIDHILEYTGEISQKEFKETTMIQDAVIRNFEIIGRQLKTFPLTLEIKTKAFPGKIWRACEIS